MLRSQYASVFAWPTYNMSIVPNQIDQIIFYAATSKSCPLARH